MKTCTFTYRLDKARGLRWGVQIFVKLINGGKGYFDPESKRRKCQSDFNCIHLFIAFNRSDSH